MPGEAVEYYSSDSFAREPALRADVLGLAFKEAETPVELGWSEVRALVPAAVQPDPKYGGQAVAALGIVLRRPFFEHPVLVDGASPNLDYAIPIDGLSEHAWARALTVTPEEVVERIADYARPAGVQILTPAATN